jgi:hypothetical protein
VPEPPGWPGAEVDVLGTVDDLLAEVGTVLAVAREVGVREMVALGDVAGVRDVVGVRGEDTGRRPAKGVPRGMPSTSTALTISRVVASKRGLQVVRVSSGRWLASRTPVPVGGTTHWRTTS